MKKLVISLILGVSVTLSACGSNSVSNEDYQELLKRVEQLESENAEYAQASEEIESSTSIEEIPMEEITGVLPTLEVTEINSETESEAVRVYLNPQGDPNEQQSEVQSSVIENTIIEDDSISTIIMDSNTVTFEYYGQLQSKAETPEYNALAALEMHGTGEFDDKLEKEVFSKMVVPTEFPDMMCNYRHPRIDTRLYYERSYFDETTEWYKNIRANQYLGHMPGNYDIHDSVNLDEAYPRLKLISVAEADFQKTYKGRPKYGDSVYPGFGDWYGDSIGLPRDWTYHIFVYQCGCAYMSIAPNDDELFIFEYPLREDVLDDLYDLF